MRHALCVLGLVLCIALWECNASKVDVNYNEASSTNKEDETIKTEDTTTTSTAAAQTGDADSSGSVGTSVSQTSLPTGGTNRSDGTGEGEASRSNVPQDHSPSQPHSATAASVHKGSGSSNTGKDGKPGAGDEQNAQHNSDGNPPGAASSLPQSQEQTSQSPNSQGNNNNGSGAESGRGHQGQTPKETLTKPSPGATPGLETVPDGTHLPGISKGTVNTSQNKLVTHQASTIQHPPGTPIPPQPQGPLVQLQDGLQKGSVSPQDAHTKSGDVRNGVSSTATRASPVSAAALKHKPHTQSGTSVRVDTAKETDTTMVTNVPINTSIPDTAKTSHLPLPDAKSEVDSTSQTEKSNDIASPAQPKKASTATTIPLSTVSNALPLLNSVEKTDSSLCSSSLFALAALATLAVAAAAPAH